MSATSASDTGSVVDATGLATSALGDSGLAGTGLDTRSLVEVETAAGDGARWSDMPLLLNGRGTRHAYRRVIIRDVGFKVYDAELYVPEPTSDSTRIIYEYPRIELRFHFLRNVSPDDLRRSADASFSNLLPTAHASHRHAENREAFIAMLAATGARKGDTVVLRFSDAAVEVVVNDEQRGTIESRDFQQLARRIWLDESMPDRGLRELRLGLLDHEALDRKALARQLPATSNVSAVGQ
ncbi:MAG: chalcone isomerase family protein [Pirellulales bacterium]